MKLKGKMYDYLGHFRQERFLKAGHNTMAEPAATQEMIREKFAGRRRRREDVSQDKDARNDLRRVQGSDAAEFRKLNRGADIHDYDTYQEWKSRNPGGNALDWTRIQIIKKEGEDSPRLRKLARE